MFSKSQKKLGPGSGAQFSGMGGEGGEGGSGGSPGGSGGSGMGKVEARIMQT
jgi:hypothetical protein